MRAVPAAPALALLAVAALVPAQPARAEENDLREFRIGMEVGELPRSGYLDFSCTDKPDIKLRGWQDYRQCPPQPSGLHAVRFQYDEAANPLSKVNDLYEGTKVGGHPVRLSLLIGDDRVKGLVVETDPAVTRLYLRKNMPKRRPPPGISSSTARCSAAAART